MTPQEHIKALNNVVRDVQSQAPVMERLGVQALTKIKQRVQQTGTNAEGSKYKAYSTKPTLIGCTTFLRKDACERVLGSKEKRKALEWRTVDGHRLAILNGGYKKIRELQGRQTAYVDFSVTNAMWNDINVISQYAQHQSGIAIIGAKQEIEKKKLAGNTERRGDILDLSNKEVDELKADYNLNVLEIFRKNGL